MPARSHALLSVPCVQCGANLPLAPELPQVTCEYCSTTFSVPSSVRERARTHLKQTSAAWVREIQARYLELLHAHAARTNPGTLRWMIPLMLALPFWLMVLPSGFAQRFHPILSATCVALTLAAAARVFGGITGPPRPFSMALIVASGIGECQQCGGPVRLREGSTSSRCEYCGASSVLNDAQRRSMLAAAVQRVAPAQASSFEAIQKNWASVRDASSVFGVFGRADLASVMLIVTIVALVALGVLGFVFFRDAPEVHDTSWVLPALLLGLLGVAAHNVAKVRRLLRARAELDAILHEPQSAPPRA
ncbi:MAG TPA: hypothetical protein VK524_34050 [Polyangiaceae bacterium]|nr:hypothetical protein [Polyangiaceae bacterium]